MGDQLVPAFKNATYWSNQKHWEWAVYPNDREKASFLKENILPIQESGQLQFISNPSAPDLKDHDIATLPSVPFTDNISIRFVDGHTEAMAKHRINNQQQ